ncbi:MAG TPA: hypothetical protein VFK85_03625 [Anaeromyxobacteraceae bacterium]|nr:hypothetical protein [Anaeromyxobacteraceae bacterium]
MQSSSKTLGVTEDLRLRCRSHPLRDLAMVAAILLLIGSFVAHAMNPAPSSPAAAYASAPTREIVAVRSPELVAARSTEVAARQGPFEQGRRALVERGWTDPACTCP